MNCKHRYVTRLATDLKPTITWRCDECDQEFKPSEGSTVEECERCGLSGTHKCDPQSGADYPEPEGVETQKRKDHLFLPDKQNKTFYSACCRKREGFCVSIGSDKSGWHYECSHCFKDCSPDPLVHYAPVEEPKPECQHNCLIWKHMTTLQCMGCKEYLPEENPYYTKAEERDRWRKLGEFILTLTQDGDSSR